METIMRRFQQWRIRRQLKTGAGRWLHTRLLLDGFKLSATSTPQCIVWTNGTMEVRYE